MYQPRNRPKRPVHYAAHGTKGLFFSCFHKELNDHITTRPLAKPLPMPLRHTDLSKVTCLDCWQAIMLMGVECGVPQAVQRKVTR